MIRGYNSGVYGMKSLTTVDVDSRIISQLVVSGGTTCVLFDTGTVACIVAGALRGAAIFRVHNISAAWFTLRALEVVK
jgi:dihydropteroate synthase